MAGKTSKSSHSKKQSKGVQDSRRKFVVFSALAGSLTVTAAFLQLLSPPPVTASANQTALLSAGPVGHVSSKLDQPREDQPAAPNRKSASAR